MARTYSPIEALESRIAPAGLITATLQGGSLFIEGDADANQLTFRQINADTFVLSSSTGDIQLDLPGNSDPDPAPEVVLRGFKGNLVIDLGAGDDALSIPQLLLGKNVTIDMGGGANTLALGAGGAFHVVGNLKVSGGDDGNSLTFGNVRTNGSVNVSLGEGPDQVDLGFMEAKSANIHLKGGNDILTVQGGKIRGALKIDAGSGGNLVTATGLGLEVGGKLSVIHGADSIPDTTQITGASARLGSVFIQNGNASSQTLFVTGALESGPIRIVNGADGGQVTFSNTFATLKSLTVEGGAGVDVLVLSTPNLSIGGNVVFKGGSGDDSAVVAAGGTIKGKLMLDLGEGTATQSINITPPSLLSVKSVDVKSLAPVQNYFLVFNTDVKGSVKASLGGTDAQLIVIGSNIQGAFQASTGNGDDKVTIESSTFNGPFSLATGGGADEVRIATSSVYEVRFNKAVKILLGDGNDTLVVGSGTPNSVAVFRNKVTFDGGAGANFEFTQNGNFYSKEPKLIGFV